MYLRLDVVHVGAASVLYKRVLLVLCMYWIVWILALHRSSVFRAHIQQVTIPGWMLGFGQVFRSTRWQFRSLLV